MENNSGNQEMLNNDSCVGGCTFIDLLDIVLYLQSLLYCLQIVTIYSLLMTGYDLNDEVGVVSGCSFYFSTDSNTILFLAMVSYLWYNLQNI